MAKTADVIPGLEADFQNRVKQQFAADKWGKKWLEKRGDVFFSGNSVDVARARAAKEEELTIIISDNGCGCEDIKEGFGLKHIRERVELLNGEVNYQGLIGFTMIAKIPIRNKIMIEQDTKTHTEERKEYD